MSIRIQFLVLAMLLVLSTFACMKSYTVDPVPVQPTATPTATHVCNGIWGTPVPCVSGITWGDSLVWSYNVNGVNQYGADLALSVNCSPETTDGVTLTGPSVSLPLAYSALITIGGSVYANYQSSPVAGSLSSGSTYTLTSTTSLGPASSSQPLPMPLTIMLGASAPPTATWNGSGIACLNLFNVSAGVTTIRTGPGYEAISPYTMGVYSCFSPCESGARFIVGTPNITGGSGVYNVTNGAIVTVP